MSTLKRWTEYWPLSEYLCPDEECTTMNLGLFSRRILQSCLTASLKRYEMNWSFTNPGLATRIHFTTGKHIYAIKLLAFNFPLSTLITWLKKYNNNYHQNWSVSECPAWQPHKISLEPKEEHTVTICNTYTIFWNIHAVVKKHLLHKYIVRFIGFIGLPCHVVYNCLFSCGEWWPQPLPLVRSWLESQEPDWPGLPASQQQLHLLSERDHMPAL